MLTGRVPFDAESAVSIALKHVSEAPPPPTAVNPSVPAELEQVVMWGLNKNPIDRPANADQFITALEQAKAAILSGDARRAHREHAGDGGGRRPEGTPPRRRSPLPAAAAPPARGDTLGGVVVGPFPEDEHPPEHRRRWPWVLLVLALLCLAGGGVAAYLLTRPAKVLVPSVTGEQFKTRARGFRMTTSMSTSCRYQPEAGRDRDLRRIPWRESRSRRTRPSR